MHTIEEYLPIVGSEVIADLHRKARPLYGKRVMHVNSTYQGGGVAEMLAELVPLKNDIGIDADWRILPGPLDFFTVTKQFHNGLQGERFELTSEMKGLYLSNNRTFSAYAKLDEDVMVIHDPQPLPLARIYNKRQPWIWRCHIDLTDPDPELWEFLVPFIMRYDAMIVSSEEYRQPNLAVRQVVFTPAIDPLALKNADMDDETVSAHLGKLGVGTDKPYVLQVSRFDKWKDMGGVVKAWKQACQDVDCRVVLCGSMASDDPEGLEMYRAIVEENGALIDSGDLIVLTDASNAEVNALQRAAAVVTQKSSREGFGLTVTEAMWKGKAVLATRVGGIPLQITNGDTGILVEPGDTGAFAAELLRLLKEPDLRDELGVRAREKVRQDFLITRLLSAYLDLLNETLA